jgi:hypothetical protein
MTGPTIKGPPVGKFLVSLLGHRTASWGRYNDTRSTFLGPDCAEGARTADQLVERRRDQTIDNRDHRYLDEQYHDSRVYQLGDIEVPILSVANLGGIMLHLRGNVVGYLEAGTPNKWLYFISGR